MEKEDLIARWRDSFNPPRPAVDHNPMAIRERLQDRLNILHRLNELGETRIEDLSVIEALEKTNALLRETSQPGRF